MIGRVQGPLFPFQGCVGGEHSIRLGGLAL
jgi:hypothetical protein